MIESPANTTRGMVQSPMKSIARVIWLDQDERIFLEDTQVGRIDLLAIGGHQYDSPGRQSLQRVLPLHLLTTDVVELHSGQPALLLNFLCVEPGYLLQPNHFLTPLNGFRLDHVFQGDGFSLLDDEG